jgi:hypothetical protein
MEEIATMITRNRGNLSSLKGRKVGDTGYYYAIDREGVIIFHPQGALAGMDFSGNPLVRRMLEKKSGCLAHYFEGMDRIVLFRPAGDGGILCLTISPAELGGDRSGCEELK